MQPQMAILVHNCPRCGAREITFDVGDDHIIGQRYDWQRIYEVFAICRKCHKGTIFRIAQKDIYSSGDPRLVPPTSYNGALNDAYKVEEFIGLKDMATAAPPDHCPPDVAAAFREGATCLAVECFNAAGAMFRLCIDLTTRPMLPPADAPDGPNARERRDLGLRLKWLFENAKLDVSLRELAKAIREDGNDGAHAGSLTQADAEDIKDFAIELLERIFTIPENLRLAEDRRTQRRAGPAPPGKR